MGAEYKDYAYGDNAKVLKNRVNNVPSPRTAPTSSGELSEEEKVLNNPEGYVPPDQKTVFTAMSEGIEKNKAIKRSNELGGNYDETVFRNKNRPSPVLGSGGGQNNTVPSKLIGAQQQAGTSRFDKSKLTLGNNPYTGQVGMFKDGQMLEPGFVRLSGGNLGGTPLSAGQSPFFMKSEAAKGLVPQPGTASAIPGMQQNPAVGMPGGNMTGVLAQDDAIFRARMANVGNDYKIGTGNPAFASDPQMAQSLARRDSLQASLDTFNRQNPLRPGASVGEIISNRAATATQRKELEALNADIFGRSDLGTKLQMAILDSLTKKGIAAGENQTALAKQGLENEGLFATRSMMESNENLRHLTGLQAGVGQPKPGEDPFAKLTTGGMMEYYKTILANNPDMKEDDFVDLLSSSSTKLKNKMSGNTSGIVKDRLGKY